MPAAFILVDSLISNPEQFKEYAALAPAAVAAAGGEYLAREVATKRWKATGNRRA